MHINVILLSSVSKINLIEKIFRNDIYSHVYNTNIFLSD